MGKLRVVKMLVFLFVFLVIVHLRSGEVVRFEGGAIINVGRTNGSFGEKKIWFQVWGKRPLPEMPPRIAIFPMDVILYGEVIE